MLFIVVDICSIHSSYLKKAVLSEHHLDAIGDLTSFVFPMFNMNSNKALWSIATSFYRE